TEHRAEITKAARLAGGGRGEIVARHRNGEVGAQAQFASLRIAREIHALADVLAGKVEERLRRLQNRGRYPRIARALERGDQRVRARVGRAVRRDNSCTRHGAFATGSAGGGGALACLDREFDAKSHGLKLGRGKQPQKAAQGASKALSASRRGRPPPVRARRPPPCRPATRAAPAKAAPRSVRAAVRRAPPPQTLPPDR